MPALKPLACLQIRTLSLGRVGGFFRVTRDLGPAQQFLSRNPHQAPTSTLWVSPSPASLGLSNRPQPPTSPSAPPPPQLVHPWLPPPAPRKQSTARWPTARSQEPGMQAVQGILPEPHFPNLWNGDDQGPPSSLVLGMLGCYACCCSCNPALQPLPASPSLGTVPAPRGRSGVSSVAGWAGLAALRLPNGRFGHRQSLWPGDVGWWLCSHPPALWSQRGHVNTAWLCSRSCGRQAVTAGARSWR